MARLLTATETAERCSELIRVGDAASLLELYEEDAVFLPEPGREIRGLDNIRAEIDAFTTLTDVTMDYTKLKVIEAGDTAVVSYRWHIGGRSQDGTAVAHAGVSADIYRRRPNGSWAVIIDDPFGGEPSE